MILGQKYITTPTYIFHMHIVNHGSGYTSENTYTNGGYKKYSKINKMIRTGQAQVKKQPQKRSHTYTSRILINIR